MLLEHIFTFLVNFYLFGDFIKTNHLLPQYGQKKGLLRFFIS